MIVYSLTARNAVLECGTVVPITHMFDIDGNITNNPKECVSFVCGTEGRWHAVDISDKSDTLEIMH